VSDCQQLARNIAGDGSWTVTTSEHRKLASYGTCVFGAQCIQWAVAYIGNQDIIDLINDSITRYQWQSPGGGLVVGSSGFMTCHSSPSVGDQGVQWGLYHM
jgi:hypothetical protein